MEQPCAFISYRHGESQEYVRHFFEYLVASRRFSNVWIDKRDMTGDIDEAMAKGVGEADVVFLMISDAYLESENCRKEFLLAANKKTERLLYIDMTPENRSKSRDMGEWKQKWLAAENDNAQWDRMVRTMFRNLILFYDNSEFKGDIRRRFAAIESHFKKLHKTLAEDVPPVEDFTTAPVRVNVSCYSFLRRCCCFPQRKPFRIFFDYEPSDIEYSSLQWKRLLELEEYLDIFLKDANDCFIFKEIWRCRNQIDNFAQKFLDGEIPMARNSIFVALITKNYKCDLLVEANHHLMHIFEIEFATERFPEEQWNAPNMESHNGVSFKRVCARIPAFDRISVDLQNVPDLKYPGSLVRIGMLLQMLLNRQPRHASDRKFYYQSLKPSNEEMLRPEKDKTFWKFLENTCMVEEMKPLLVFGEIGIGKTTLVSIVLNETNVAKLFVDCQVTICLWTNYRDGEFRAEEYDDKGSVPENEGDQFLQWFYGTLQHFDADLRNEFEKYSFKYDSKGNYQNLLKSIFKKLGIHKLLLILDDVPLAMLRKLPELLARDFDPCVVKLVMIADMADVAELRSSPEFSYTLFKLEYCNAAEMKSYFQRCHHDMCGRLSSSKLDQLSNAVFGLVDVGDIAMSGLRLKMEAKHNMAESFGEMLADLQSNKLGDPKVLANEKRYTQDKHIFRQLANMPSKRDVTDCFRSLFIFKINHLASCQDLSLMWWNCGANNTFPPVDSAHVQNMANKLQDLGIAKTKVDLRDETDWGIGVHKLRRLHYIRYLNEIESNMDQMLEKRELKLRREISKTIVDSHPLFMSELLKIAERYRRVDLAEAIFDLYQSANSLAISECSNFAIKNLQEPPIDVEARQFYLHLTKNVHIQIMELSVPALKFKLFHRLFGCIPADDVLETFFSIEGANDKRADIVCKQCDFYGKDVWRLLCSFEFLGKIAESQYRQRWIFDTAALNEKRMILDSFLKHTTTLEIVHLQKQIDQCTMIRWLVRCGSTNVCKSLIPQADKDPMLLFDAVRCNQLALIGEIFKLFYMSSDNLDATPVDPSSKCYPTVFSATNGLIRMTKLFISEWRILSHVDSTGRNFLFKAASNGHVHMIEYVKQSLPETKFHTLVLHRDDFGRTLLFEAAESGHVDFIQYVINLNVGLDGHEEDKLKRTVVFVAAAFGQFSVLQFIKRNIDLAETIDKNRQTPLFLAVENPDRSEVPQIFKKLIDDSKVDPMAIDVEGKTALKSAIQHQNLPSIIYLLDSCPALLEYGCGKNGKSAIFYAIETGNFEIFSYILSKNPENRRIASDDYFPILTALKLSKSQILTAMLGYKGGFNIRDFAKGTTPLIHAINCWRFELAKDMIVKYRGDVDPNFTKLDGQTPISATCSLLFSPDFDSSKINELLDVIEKLMEAGADILSTNRCESPLIMVLREMPGHEHENLASSICRILIKNTSLQKLKALNIVKTTVDNSDDNDSILSLAVKAQDKMLISILLEKGLDPFAFQDQDGWNFGRVIADYCSPKDEKGILYCFRKLPEFFSYQNSKMNGQTFLMHAVRTANLALINKLFLFEARPVAKREFLLHEAVATGDLSVVKCVMNWLEERFVNEIRDNQTAYDYAKSRSIQDMVRFLEKRGAKTNIN